MTLRKRNSIPSRRSEMLFFVSTTSWSVSHDRILLSWIWSLHLSRLKGNIFLQLIFLLDFLYISMEVSQIWINWYLCKQFNCCAAVWLSRIVGGRIMLWIFKKKKKYSFNYFSILFPSPLTISAFSVYYSYFMSHFFFSHIIRLVRM